MSDISTLLNSLYSNNSDAEAIEKTAEDILLAELSGVSENSYAGMTNEELQAILDGDTEKTASAVDEMPELLEKTAAEMLGGQIMAHAMVHEMGIIKEAMKNGLCRVCKDSAMDIQGSSICSGCQAQSE